MRTILFAIIFSLLALLSFATRAMADAPATRPSMPLVVIFRFDVVSDSNHAWVGQAVQEGIASGIAQAGAFDAKQSPAIPASADEAIHAAAGMDAARVIVGTCQIVNDQLRITGSVIDVATGKTLGGLHSTAGLRDLFNLEDALASQSGRLLTPSPCAVVNLPPPAIDLNVTMTIPQPTYFSGDIRSELAVPDRFSAQWQQYSNSQYPCYYGGGYGCCGGYRAFLLGRACAGGNCGWYPTAQPLSTW